MKHFVNNRIFQDITLIIKQDVDLVNKSIIMKLKLPNNITLELCLQTQQAKIKNIYQSKTNFKYQLDVLMQIQLAFLICLYISVSTT